MARYDTQEAEGFAPNHDETPALVSLPVVFIAPSDRTVSGGEIWIAVSCVSANYGGSIVHVSNDGATYHRIGVIRGNATHGVLTAALPSGSGTDVTNTLAVDVADTGNTIEPVSQATADTHDSLVYAGGEFLAYRDATLTGIGAYNLTHLKRGLYGSTAGAVSGAEFALIDSSIFRYGFNKNLVGSTVYLKFQAFNNVGGGLQALSDLVAYSFVVSTDGGVKALQSDIPSLVDYYNKTYIDAEFADMTAYVDGGLAGKQDDITLTTTGTSGAATLIGATLNIPNYAGGGGSSSSDVFNYFTF